jgi:hypothetical protein
MSPSEDVGRTKGIWAEVEVGWMTVLGRPPVEPIPTVDGDCDTSLLAEDGVASTAEDERGPLSEADAEDEVGWITVPGTPPDEPTAGVDETTSPGPEAGVADDVGCTMGRGIPPEEPAAEVSGTTSLVSELGVAVEVGCTIGKGIPPVEPTLDRVSEGGTSDEGESSVGTGAGGVYNEEEGSASGLPVPAAGGLDNDTVTIVVPEVIVVSPFAVVVGSSVLENSAPGRDSEDESEGEIEED